MPSWNIHAAHVERLLAEEDPGELGIRDANAFLFGNFVPDIYVGYLVPDVDHTLRYCDTHVTEPHAIPIPGADEFWDEFIEPNVAEDGVDDLTLGVWAHLMADNRYNTFVRAFNDEHGIPAGNETRIRKQSDFDRFGKALAPALVPEVTPELLREAEAFGPYEIGAEDVVRAIAAAKRLLNPAEPARISANAPEAVEASVGLAPSAADGYLLLTRDFLEETFDAADAAIREGLRRYAAEVRAAGGDPAAPAPHRVPKRRELPVGPPPSILLAKNPEAAASTQSASSGEFRSR